MVAQKFVTKRKPLFVERKKRLSFARRDGSGAPETHATFRRNLEIQGIKMEFRMAWGAVQYAEYQRI